MSKTEPEYRCRAKFIYNHGQKPSLAFVTPATMSSALHRMYPLLLMADATLSNVMWLSEDLCLQFVHLVMICLTVSVLCDDPQWNVSHIVKMWAGMLCLFFLPLSFAYYILTLYGDLRDSEPPTLDDIVVVLESVVDKLETIRHELLNRIIVVSGKTRAIKLAVGLTPFHFVLMKLISVKNYILGFTLVCIFYHSNWYQCTMKLFWRILITRKMYYTIAEQFSTRPKIYRIPISMEKAIQFNNCVFLRDLPDEMKQLEGHKLQLQLQKLFPRDEPLDEASPCISNDFQIIDLQIQENQRKWQADGWTTRVLPYEKPKYCIDLRDGLHACNSPWQFQEGNLDDWNWLDDCWRPTGWTYSDTMWGIIGENDSLESCTRSRIWKRRIFRIAKKI